MKPKNVYLLLCVLGTVLPYSQFVPWVMEYGMNLGLLVRQLFRQPHQRLLRAGCNCLVRSALGVSARGRAAAPHAPPLDSDCRSLRSGG